MGEKRTNHEIIFAFWYLTLGLIGVLIQMQAPDQPDKSFISLCLGLAVVTLTSVYVAKRFEPKPINWVTAEVLFATAYCLIHFSYYAYWVFGFFGSQSEIWYLRSINVPHTVCSGLAMYVAALNMFLFGFSLIRCKRYIPLINESRPPKNVAKAWGVFGRLLIRLGFCGFAAFVGIVGPSVFFGVYSGTSNISFIGNIFFQVGQVLLMSGMVVSMASRQRVLARSKSRSNWLGVSFIDILLIMATIVAIGAHGDRSTLLFIFGAFVVSYCEYVKAIPLERLIVAALVLIFFLGFIIAFRSSRANEYDFDPVKNINSAMANMGTSSVCGFVAIDYAEDNFAYGRMQLKQLAGIVPFGRRLFGIGDEVENSSSMMLTYLIQGKVGRGVSGTGTSVFADLYFDFGFLGAILIFFLVGMLTKTIQNRARMSTSIIWQVIFVNLVTFLAICSRYTFADGLIRIVLYSGLYTYFFASLFQAPLRYNLNRNQIYPPRTKPASCVTSLLESAVNSGAVVILDELRSWDATTAIREWRADVSSLPSRSDVARLFMRKSCLPR